MAPLVSVVIPAYNAQATLAETVRSLLAQSLTDWRAMIVDDGSTDSTPAIAQDFAWRDPRIAYHRQPNRGLSGARNAGLERATGAYVHFLDADDWLAPLGLERLVQAAEWSGRGAACGSWSLHGADARPLGLTISPPDQVVGLEHFAETNALAPHAHVVRRDLLDGLRFDESLRVVEDYDLWLRLASRGVRWSAVEETVAGYRVRPGSLSKNPRLMLETHAAVARRTLGEAPAARGLRKAALFYATSAALAGPAGGMAGPRATLRAALPNPPVFGPEELGAAGHWALVLGFGIAPERLAKTAPRWLGRLEAWWRAIAGEESVEPARRALAEHAVSPERIAGAMLDRAGPGPLVLAGAMGRNGRELRRAGAARGRRMELRDDRLPRAGIDRLIDSAATVLVAPLEDRGLVRRLPRGLRVVRWSTTRAGLASELLGALGRAAAEARPA